MFNLLILATSQRFLVKTHIVLQGLVQDCSCSWHGRGYFTRAQLGKLILTWNNVFPSAICHICHGWILNDSEPWHRDLFGSMSISDCCGKLLKCAPIGDRWSFSHWSIKGKEESIQGIASFIQDGAGVRGCSGLREVPKGRVVCVFLKPWIIDSVGNPIKKHPQVITIDGWYGPSPNAGFIIGLPTFKKVWLGSYTLGLLKVIVYFPNGKFTIWGTR
jgi:hypothetical protein